MSTFVLTTASFWLRELSSLVFLSCNKARHRVVGCQSGTFRSVNTFTIVAEVAEVVSDERKFRWTLFQFLPHSPSTLTSLSFFLVGGTFCDSHCQRDLLTASDASAGGECFVFRPKWDIVLPWRRWPS